MDIDEWRRLFDVMINGCVLVSKMAVPFMKDGGRIIHISSIHAKRAEKCASSYAMAKAAINQCCRALAVELAEKNILVNAIAPGFVDTPMSVVDGKSELESEWFKENYVQGHHLPLKRAAQPSEIAGVAFFLAGKDASYITGQVITVDGGLTITF
jgi:3-oxoacyl-[acyl-carrier protein] reductase